MTVQITMQIFSALSELRSAVAQIRQKGERVALVPTMGALHAGHMALVEEAKHYADHVAVSIFVNPSQFGPNEDFGRYPRQEAADIALLEAAGTAMLWLPSVDAMYPAGYPGGDVTRISVTGVSDGLCGPVRPGHFTGVATVVAKLFLQVQPDAALFGEKDFQQLAVIRAMVRDLAFPINIIGVPTLRDIDGLALSSRNAYLSPQERAAAAAIPQLCREAVTALEAGTDIAKTINAITRGLIAAGFDRPDYVAVCDAETLQPVTMLTRPARLLVAARIGKTRLIDNFAINSPV
jgi:pantoate--beta-alanine ligase